MVNSTLIWKALAVLAMLALILFLGVYNYAMSKVPGDQPGDGEERVVDHEQTSSSTNTVTTLSMDAQGDGSAPDPHIADNAECDCQWMPGITSLPPYTEGNGHGLCYFEHGGKTVVGNLNARAKVCDAVYQGRPFSTSVYSFLAGDSCDPLFVRRGHCSTSPLRDGASGICKTKDGRFGALTRSDNGVWGCSTSNGREAQTVCADFTYERGTGRRCRVPTLVDQV